MKKIFFLSIAGLICNSIISQNSNSYQSISKVADSLYRSKDYKNAGINYSAILRLPDLKPSIWDWNHAAFSWAAAGNADSAFHNLNEISKLDTVTFSDYLDIVTDRDYNSLRELSKWSEINNRIFVNARSNFYRTIKNANEKELFGMQYYAARAWAINKNPDSAFYFLNKLSVSNALTFDNADRLIKNGDLESLKTNRQWPAIEQTIFHILNKKYIPSTSFKAKKQKRLLIDGAHYNFHDIKGTYAVMAGMFQQSGFKVSGLTEKISNENLKDIDLFIISNPASDRMDSLNRRAQRAKEPPRWSAVTTQPAFTETEVKAVKNWVRNGGSLLLILDHAPYGKSGGAMAEAFGIENRNVGTYDRLSRDPEIDTTKATTILFTRSNGLIGEHPIVNGLDSLTTYTGESLIGPANSSVLLLLPSTAYDEDWLPETRQRRYRTAAGRSRAVAFDYGKGRVVMLGEAAQTRPEFLSRSNRDSWKFLLNIIRWLSREEVK